MQLDYFGISLHEEYFFFDLQIKNVTCRKAAIQYHYQIDLYGLYSTYVLQNITGNAFCKLVYNCFYRTEETNDCIMSTVIAIVVTVLVLAITPLVVFITLRLKISKRGITKLSINQDVLIGIQTV